MRLTPEQIAETQEAMRLHTHPDGRPNAERIAKALGLAPSTVKNRLRHIANIEAPTTYEQIHGRKILKVGALSDDFLERLKAAECGGPKVVPLSKPKYRVPYIRGVASEPANDETQSAIEMPVPANLQSDEVKTVLAFSDSHDKPGRCKKRFRWIGRHAMSKKFDAVVANGDTASMDSVSGHDEPGSQGDIEKPYFWEDLDSLDEALSLFHSECPVGHLPIYHPHGNHEARTATAAKRLPKQCGDMPVRLDQVFARYRWQTLPYGEILDLFGVQWVHTILNKMGRPSNGEFPEQLHGKKQIKDLVLGHTHTHNVVTIGKNSERVRVVNLGTSMPWGMREQYTPKTAPPWDYGICEIRIQSGKIISTKYIDMLELQEMYGELA